MKIVTNQMPLHSTSVDDLEVNSIHQPYSITDVDKPKGDLKVFPEELSDTTCHKQDADPLSVEMKDYTIDFLRDGCSVVTKCQTEVSLDDPLEMHSREGRTDLESNFQSSAGVRGGNLEHLVPQECCREPADIGDVRDIRVDEGTPTNDSILVEDNADGHKFMVEDSYAANDTKYGLENDKVEVGWPLPVALKSMIHEASEEDFRSCDSKGLGHQSESESESTYLVLSDTKDKNVDTLLSDEVYAELLHSNKLVDRRCCDKPNLVHQDSTTEFKDATDKLSSSAPDYAFKETADDDTLKSSDMKIDLGLAATNNHSLSNDNEVKLPSVVFHLQMADASQMPEQQNLASDHLASSARIERDCLESSFASVGPHTNSIAYSGSVAYSGSLSHRSDASTVSTRSFAFPVLQNEWNFSPVRMRKASRRQLGRRRGWMNGLFCCKF